MKEIIVKNDGQDVFSLEIYEDKLRIYIGDNEMGSSEDFSIEEIDDLQQSISIMKDRLERKLSNITDKSDKMSDNVISTEQKLEEESVFLKKYNEISKQVALGEKVEYKIGNDWYIITEIIGDLASQPLLDCRIRKNKK